MEFFGAVLERHGDMFEQQALQFGGTFGEMFTCLGCRRESVLNRHESFVTLGVEAEDGELCELVDRYLVQKALRKWCEQCGRNTKHSSRKYVEVWGTHLLVQVERFKPRGWESGGAQPGSGEFRARRCRVAVVWGHCPCGSDGGGRALYLLRTKRRDVVQV